MEGLQHRRRNNNATGVAVGLQKKWFNESNVRQIYTPAAKFQGRLGGLRIHSHCNDVFILVGYAPCEPAGSDGKQAEERRQEISEFWTEVTRILNTLPQRCWPILLLDANAKVGRVHANLHCDSLFLDEHIGGENAERENYNGTHLCTWRCTYLCLHVRRHISAGRRLSHQPPSSPQCMYPCVQPLHCGK